MGCWSGAEGLAAAERQGPGKESYLAGRSTAVLGVSTAPTPVVARACGTR